VLDAHLCAAIAIAQVHSTPASEREALDGVFSFAPILLTIVSPWAV
jgi:hypothetical protein